MFTVEFKTENAAFQEWQSEIPRIMRLIADRMERGDIAGTIFDSNGNSVGEYIFDPGEFSFEPE